MKKASEMLEAILCNPDGLISIQGASTRDCDILCDAIQKVVELEECLESIQGSLHLVEDHI